LWNCIPLPQHAFNEGKGHHFKKDHCPMTWQKSVIVEVHLDFVPSLSDIQLPHLIAGVVDAINGVTKTKLTSATPGNCLSQMKEWM